MLCKIIRKACEALGWLYQLKKHEDAISGIIEGIVGALVNLHNDGIDHKRNKYIKKHKTSIGCIERYQYITSLQFLHTLPSAEEQDITTTIEPLNIQLLSDMIRSSQKWLETVEFQLPAMYDELYDSLYYLQLAAGICLYHEQNPEAEPGTLKEHEYHQAVYDCIDSIIDSSEANNNEHRL